MDIEFVFVDGYEVLEPGASVSRGFEPRDAEAEVLHAFRQRVFSEIKGALVEGVSEAA